MMFYFRLARELGITINRMLKEMTSREIASWMTFFDIEERQRQKKKESQSSKLIAAQFKAAGQQVAEHKKRKKVKNYAKRKV